MTAVRAGIASGGAGNVLLAAYFSDVEIKLCSAASILKVVSDKKYMSIA